MAGATLLLLLQTGFGGGGDAETDPVVVYTDLRGIQNYRLSLLGIQNARTDLHGIEGYRIPLKESP